MGIHLRHSTYKREKYAFINANIRVINIILTIIRDNRQTSKCKRYSLTCSRMDKTNINALVQSIERSLHLIDKNLFSIKQYQFPPKIGLNLFKESRRTSLLCVRRRLRLYIYPRRPEVMVGRDREWRAYR